MDKRIIYFQIVLLVGLLFSSCGNVYEYHCEEDDFSFSVIEEKDSTMFIFNNMDTIVYQYCLNGIYDGINILVPDSSNKIYIQRTYVTIKRIMSYSNKIELVNRDTMRYLEKNFASGQGCVAYYGCMNERGGRYAFSYFRNGKYRYLLRPIE